MPDPSLRIAVIGGRGRVGRLVVDEVDAADDLDLVAVLGRDDDHPPTCDALIDFSSPAGTRRWAPIAADCGVPLVSGTTGLAAADEAALDAAAGRVPVLHATNTSLGVALLNRLAADAARVLGDAFDVELVEQHHRHKKDAPSGTAATLADRLLAARGADRDALVHGRHGADATRKAGSIGVHSLRLGDVVGRHEAHFAGIGERLCVWHEATDRRTFARGAIRAARWLIDRPVGRYAMDDVLADALSQ